MSQWKLVLAAALLVSGVGFAVDLEDVKELADTQSRPAGVFAMTKGDTVTFYEISKLTDADRRVQELLKKTNPTAAEKQELITLKDQFVAKMLKDGKIINTTQIASASKLDLTEENKPTQACGWWGWRRGGWGYRGCGWGGYCGYGGFAYGGYGYGYAGGCGGYYGGCGGGFYGGCGGGYAAVGYSYGYGYGAGYGYGYGGGYGGGWYY